MLSCGSEEQNLGPAQPKAQQLCVALSANGRWSRVTARFVASTVIGTATPLTRRSEYALTSHATLAFTADLKALKREKTEVILRNQVHAAARRSAEEAVHAEAKRQKKTGVAVGQPD